ncbi:competence type IV pilus minor pilin ComGG [Bacillus pseudomycoides]|uniref:competence type IV pilus minor pilin ComGG n=1 Tax=Bacillus pseudomycoides TaxID=64104 RepID=UPI000BEB8307|nr:competence type IV pilus minor pilin ComGG [Bacillus pseudomycoides]PEB43145.1 competence protein ComG [Bacillus pseudomycoides]PGD95150.1 competence protein ComG [Bacillus pseudomycoides]PGE04035.1 competence protein ComG [Bacillus pseudomycoides]PHE67102.1 competence protein ComG [Bacillus pseudomycoides]PHG26252.1 competence protein ComG [Bacillus pseudomycoides]
MRKQAGFAMPGTLILLFLLFSFFIYEINMLKSDQRFYKEAQQKFLLEEIADQAVSSIKDDLQEKEQNAVFSFRYENGEASGNYVFENEIIFVALQCMTKQNRSYKVNFQYDKINKRVMNWVEER